MSKRFVLALGIDYRCLSDTHFWKLKKFFENFTKSWAVWAVTNLRRTCVGLFSIYKGNTWNFN